MRYNIQLLKSEKDGLPVVKEQSVTVVTKRLITHRNQVVSL